MVDTLAKPSSNGSRQNRKIRYGVAGLGHIAQAAVLPAFRHAENSELAVMFSDDPEKREQLSKRYGVPVLPYSEYERGLADNGAEAVFVAVPDRQHAEYTLRAAAAGVHVLCEKPMAETEAACQEMIDACEQAGVKLMIAYRLHFDIANLEAVDVAQSGQLGDLRIFNSLNVQNVAPGNIRLRRETARGPLFDMGVYCINAARYLFRDEPTEAFCQHFHAQDDRFREVPEMSSVVLRFPMDRVAVFTCGFGSAAANWYELVGTEGRLRMDPAFGYVVELKRELITGDKTEQKSYPVRDQFAPELIYFSDCILQNREPEPSGLEGLLDVRIVEACYRSAETGAPVRLPEAEKDDRPELSMAISRPPVEEAELVDAQSPTGD